jgi:glutamine cyclotransferase
MPGQTIARSWIRIAAIMGLIVSSSVQVSRAEQSLKAAENKKRIVARVSKRLVVPRSYHEGLYYDGRSIWLSNGEGGKTWVIDTSSGAVSSEIETVAGFTEAITAKGDGTFYTTEWDEKKVYRVGLEGDKLAVRSSVSVAPAHPAGAIWTGRRLYVILWDRGLLGTRFSIVEMDGDMKILDRIQIRTIQEPCQLAWDGARLWMTSWYDKRVYKIDVGVWEILGYFCSPVEKTTGIAWDGKKLWLTATYGDLYQMDVEN